MPRRKPTEEEKRRSWAAISRAAMIANDHHTERGLGVLIANDAGVTPQSVSDWKRGATSPDDRQIMKLAIKYGVSAEELAGLVPHDREPKQAFAKNDEFSLAVLELSEEVTALLLPEGRFDQYQAINAKAHELLLEGRDRDSAFGSLYRFVKNLKQREASDEDA